MFVTAESPAAGAGLEGAAVAAGLSCVPDAEGFGAEGLAGAVSGDALYWVPAASAADMPTSVASVVAMMNTGWPQA